jgi:diguanylate cyclase (GGDEF)-like protein
MYLRKGNLKFIVTQDNANRKLVINDLIKIIDERREGDYFGVNSNQLQGKNFSEVLPSELNEIIDENIEYNIEGNDLKNVIDKIIHFKVLDKDKKPIDMNAHVERDVSVSGDSLKFSVILERKIFLRDKVKSILASLSEYQQVEHPVTGVINTAAFYEITEELLDYMHETNLEAVMCIISIEGFPLIRMSEGKEKSNEILSQIGLVMKSNFRSKDVVGYLGFGRFAVLMVRTFEDEVSYPLKRLESNLRKQGVLNSKITYNARFQKVDLTLDSKAIIDSIKNKKVDYTFGG